MKIKESIFSEKSERGVALYTKLLRWLDSPARKKYNNPVKLVERAGIVKGHVVLELGCGSGFFTEEISKQVGAEGKVYATDIHPISVCEMNRKIKQLGLTNVVAQKEDALHTSFADNSVDMIILYGVIPAPVIPTKELSVEMYRILKPDGVCAIWTAVPFWRPKGIERSARFTRLKRNYPIFRLQKKV